MNSETVRYQLGSQTKLLPVSVAEWIKWSVLQDRCPRLLDSIPGPAFCSRQFSEHKLHLSLTNICYPPKQYYIVCIKYMCIYRFSTDLTAQMHIWMSSLQTEQCKKLLVFNRNASLQQLHSYENIWVSKNQQNSVETVNEKWELNDSKSKSIQFHPNTRQWGDKNNTAGSKVHFIFQNLPFDLIVV